MGLSTPGIAITVVASFIAATVLVLLVGYLVNTLIALVDRRHSPSPVEQLEAEYRATRRAMNDTAGQSWRNLIE